MEMLKTILLMFGGNATLLVAVGWLGKSFVSNFIEKNIKQLEHDLRAKSDSDIERLRNELQLRTIEHQVRFSRLHEKRATVIAELYAHLIEVLWEAESFLSPMQWPGEPSKEAKHALASNKLVDFFQFFDKHRIYLPEPLCISLEAFVMSIREHVIKFGVYTRLGEGPLSEHARKEKDETWNDGWKAITNDAPKARKELEDEFRVLLGAMTNPSISRWPEASF